MAENFKVFIRVRYAECDAQEVVFNARYADYVDVAATEYLRVLFGGYQSLLEQGIDNQVVRLGIGNSSYAFKLGFREYSSRRQLALAEIVYVMVTPIEYRKQSIPDSFREALQAGAKGKRVDFSGAQIPVC
jgi:acyl-CoA thioester hydrolase